MALAWRAGPMPGAMTAPSITRRIVRPAPLISAPSSLRLPPLLLRPMLPTVEALAATVLEWRRGVLGWLWEGILRAVPKRRVTHSRKRMRSAHKGLELQQAFVECPGCGKPKRRHHFCLDCYADIMLERGFDPGTKEDPTPKHRLPNLVP